MSSADHEEECLLGGARYPGGVQHDVEFCFPCQTSDMGLSGSADRADVLACSPRKAACDLKEGWWQRQRVRNV